MAGRDDEGRDGGADELARLRAEVEALAAALRRAGAEGLGALGREARGKAGEAAGNLGGEWAELEARLVEETRANPLRTLGFAALAGLVVGLLVRR